LLEEEHGRSVDGLSIFDITFVEAKQTSRANTNNNNKKEEKKTCFLLWTPSHVSCPTVNKLLSG
jgi:hypothetical protein